MLKGLWWPHRSIPVYIQQTSRSYASQRSKKPLHKNAKPPSKKNHKGPSSMKVAIEGCAHGELDAIYDRIAFYESQPGGSPVDLLLICGDFQAIRNMRDLQCMAVPDKYKQLGGFHKYYTGKKVAPILTIVIGGNHEASNYFWELYHGGWIAPNIYFLGHAGCVQVNGIRIAGASGIFKPHDFSQGHWERLPYTPSAMRSIYHVREFTIRRLSLLSRPHIFLSHDWPQSVEHHGDVHDLLRRKKFLRQDIETGALGSPPMMGLLRTLKPDWWFSAHLHCRHEATVVHHAAPQPAVQSLAAGAGAGAEGTNPDEIAIEDEDEVPSSTAPPPALPEDQTQRASSPPAAAPRNPDEITLDEEEETVEAPPPPPPIPSQTKFLALGKCLPRLRREEFLEIIDIDAPIPPTTNRSKPTLTFDPEWLAITRAFHPYMSLERHQHAYPDEPQARAAVQRELDWVRQHVLDETGKGVRAVEDCQEFVVTAPGPGSEGAQAKYQPGHFPNPQTAAFCAMLEIENKVDYTA